MGQEGAGELARVKNRFTVEGSERTLMNAAYIANSQARRRQFT